MFLYRNPNFSLFMYIHVYFFPIETPISIMDFPLPSLMTPEGRPVPVRWASAPHLADRRRDGYLELLLPMLANEALSEALRHCCYPLVMTNVAMENVP